MEVGADKLGGHSRPYEYLVAGDLGRMRCKGKEGEETAPLDRIGAKPSFQAPQRILVLEQRDDHAFRRGMLAWSEPCVATATGRRNRRDVSSEDCQSLRLFSILQPEPREPKEHGLATARVRKDLAGPASLSPPAGVTGIECSVGRTSRRNRRSARSAAPTKASSSSTPTPTIRSSITFDRSATSAGPRPFRTGTPPRP